MDACSSSSLDLRDALIGALKAGDEDGFFRLADTHGVDLLQRFPWSPDGDDLPLPTDGSVRAVTELDTLLSHAVRHGCHGVAKRLLELGEDPNHLGDSRMTVLADLMFHAPSDPDDAPLDLMLLLLAKGADMDRSLVPGTEGPYTARNVARRLGKEYGVTWPLWVLEEWWPMAEKKLALRALTGTVATDGRKPRL